MSRRPATVSQADIARSIRAALAAGLTVVRVVARHDGVAIETAAVQSATEGAEIISGEKEIIL